MLSHIQITDFAIIDKVELELEGGLTTLSGETGAGKSILVDALALVLGARAEAGMVRHGAKRTDISASFELENDHPALQWLSEQALDSQGECIIRRVIQEGGRSRGFVNGQQVPVQTLKHLGQYLADIHGQHEHQSLTRRSVQKQIVDLHGNHKSALDKLSKAFDDWQSLNEQLEKMIAAQQDRDSRLDLLGYQVKELQALNLQIGELEQLEDEHKRLANLGRLVDGVQTALSLAGDEGGATNRLTDTLKALNSLVEIDPTLKPAQELLESAEIQIGEACSELARYLSTLDIDPNRLEEVEKRLSSIEDLARKHRTEPPMITQLTEELSKELDTLQNAEVHLTNLQEQTQAAADNYQSQAKKLSTKRKKIGKKLAAEITSMMQTLGMPGGRFEITFDTLDTPARDGLDQIEYLVSANPGQPTKPLSKVASGGELARISLAIQVTAAYNNGGTTMVFDEVDSGVGGGIAEIVGRQLRTLAASQQVLCVTHLPQVASQAHHHVRVNKLTDGKNTRTSLTHLTNDETVEEIARMLGGVKITERTREHAREMLESAGQ